MVKLFFRNLLYILSVLGAVFGIFAVLVGCLKLLAMSGTWGAIILIVVGIFLVAYITARKDFNEAMEMEYQLSCRTLEQSYDDMVWTLSHTPKESDEPESSTPVKYYRVTAYTPYCGEHLEDFIATSSEDELEAFKQNLIEDCAAEWEPCWVDYEEEGYESEDEWQEAYYGGCGATVEEITEAEYKEETKPRWPYELVKKEVD